MQTKFTFLFWGLATLSHALVAQSFHYKIDLKNIKDDKVRIELITPPIKSGSAVFRFPMTVPGTYATLDYGRFIDGLQAFDASGQTLQIKKEGNNSFRISQADKLYRITYKVDDTFDAVQKKNKVFEPAGTNIDAEKNFIINGGGFFGYFEGMELIPYRLEFLKPFDFYGSTVLPQTHLSNELQIFEAENYHKVVDCPILFSTPDTASFFIKNTQVLISVYHQSKTNYSDVIKAELESSMDAIDKFLPSLPVDKYAFLLYISDFKDIGEAIKSGNRSKALQMMKKANLNGLGALEHGNSSMYFLGDFGVPSMDATDMLKDVAIHEFMHIITPLNLHSQHIGNFNYANPSMSKHLWLYEGVTEYFAGLIQLRADMISLDQYISEKLDMQYSTGKKFPYTKMSFTEMSENVLRQPWSKQYDQVYQRGAVLALFLDMEIIKLTQGSKNLRDVVYGLSTRYGAEKSFEEDSLFAIFTSEVHPDLQRWFDKYLSSRKDWNPKDAMETVGIRHGHESTQLTPKHPIMYAKKWNAVPVNNKISVTSISKDNKYGFKKGDAFEVDAFRNIYLDENGGLLPEGTKRMFPFERDGMTKEVEITLEYTKKKAKTEFFNDPEKTETERKYLDFWMGR